MFNVYLWYNGGACKNALVAFHAKGQQDQNYLDMDLTGGELLNTSKPYIVTPIKSWHKSEKKKNQSMKRNSDCTPKKSC